jgi:hypothetical protein
MANGINNNIRYFPCQWRWYYCDHLHSILPIITYYNSFLKLQNFLKKVTLLASLRRQKKVIGLVRTKKKM